MDKDQARRIITDSFRAELPRDKSGRGYICPVCNSGTGRKGTGMTENPNSEGRFTCWAGCFSNASAFDLIAYQEGLISREQIGQPLTAEEIQAAYRRYNLPMDNSAPQTYQTKSAPKKQETKAADQAQKKDFTDYYKICADRISATEAKRYLQKRRISDAVISKFNLGYDPKADPAEAGHPTPRIIIPVTKEYYIARRIDGIEDFKALNNKGAGGVIFNEAAIYAADTTAPLFVTEGIFDAMSIYEVGGEAIALNSAANFKRLLSLMDGRPTKRTLILSLDTDKTGRAREADLLKGLKERNIRCLQADIITKQYKDENERLVSDYNGLKDAVETAIRAAAKPDNVKDYVAGLMFNDLEAFQSKKIKTGFEELDKKMNGVYSGLYVLAATSSLGKTTFLHQVADQMAAAGNDVLYFSLEQSRLELVMKSFARTLYEKTLDDKEPSSLQLRTEPHYEETAYAGGVYYKQIEDRLSIIEGNFGFTVDSIIEYTRQYISDTGIKPIVFVDYLQILKGSDRKSPREQIDENVTALKRLSRNEDIPVFIISSINRMNYLNPIDFESLKESGGIEYSADVVLGMQLQCITDDTTPKGQEFAKAKDEAKKRAIVKEEKRANPRRVQLVCLKNRYGISSYEQGFTYYPAHDYFLEDE